MNNLILKRIRQWLAATSFLLLTLLFLDFTGTLQMWFGWLASVQFIPALLASNIVILSILLGLTLLFGRIYCSVICPLGIMQDGVAHFAKMRNKRPYGYSVANNWLRYAILIGYGMALILGFSVIVSLLDPYAAYGRIAHSLLQPLWLLGNNTLAYLSERVDSYAFYQVDIWIKSGSVVAVSVITLLSISILAWRKGRTYCNLVCPVGTILGFVSQFSLFRIQIDPDKCNGCTICATNCKSSCIDTSQYLVDNSRCVGCMNCLSKCKKGAISYALSLPKSTGEKSKAVFGTNNRRGFMIVALSMTATAIKSQSLPKDVKMKVDGGLADILPKRTPKRNTSITPPGSYSARNFSRKCTACQLCISSCPNGVLQPSSSLDNFMQPTMSFEKGYCRSECVRCSEVCPTDAIKKIDTAQKSATQIGHAVWRKGRCIVVRESKKCNNCERQCPVSAIKMIDQGFAHPIPMIDTERCIGCGACEHLCPSRPLSAMYVEGHTMHRTI